MAQGGGYKITFREVIVGLVVILVLWAIFIPGVVGPSPRNRENQSASDASNLALACSNYNTDRGSYPDGKTSTEAFKKLFPEYLQDPNSLFLVPRTGHTEFTGMATSELTKANVCWTITMNNGAGLNGSDPPNLPMLLSDLGGDYPKFSNGVETRVTLDYHHNIWRSVGVTVASLDQSTRFMRPKADSPNQIILTTRDFSAPPEAAYAAVAP